MEFDLANENNRRDFVDWFWHELIDSRKSSGSARDLNMSLWIPSSSVSMAASELALLDRESRNMAGLYLASSGFERIPRILPLDLDILGGYYWMLFDMVPAQDPWLSLQEGSLQIVKAERGESLLIDLAAVGAVLQAFTDIPVAYVYLRGIIRHIAIRVTKSSREKLQKESERIIEVYTGNIQKGNIEAQRIARRITIRRDDYELTLEEFGDTTAT